MAESPQTLDNRREGTPGGEDAWRLFIALPLPAQQQAALADLIQRLRKGAQFTPCRPAWATPEMMHLTLAFLGNRPPAEVDRLAACLRESAQEFAPLRLEIKGLGVFPDWRAPRVLWAGLRERTHQLEPLQAELAGRLRALGIALDGKPFKPHLTLARFKSLKGTGAFQKTVEAHKDFRVTAGEIGNMVLFRSTLASSGARHFCVAKAAFGKANAETKKPKAN